LSLFQDHDELYSMGVAAIYGPGTRIPAAALDMIQLLVGGDEDDDSQQQTAAHGTADS
jgi:methylmalonyl-CoA mutase cobalamin-binding subunit